MNAQKPTQFRMMPAMGKVVLSSAAIVTLSLVLTNRFLPFSEPLNKLRQAETTLQSKKEAASIPQERHDAEKAVTVAREELLTVQKTRDSLAALSGVVGATLGLFWVGLDLRRKTKISNKLEAERQRKELAKIKKPGDGLWLGGSYQFGGPRDTKKTI